MKAVRQTKKVVKDEKGNYIKRGNCFAACVASILEVEIDEVPNVETLFHIDENTWIEFMLTFLNSLGFDLTSGNDFGAVSHSGGYYIVSGKTIRNTTHVCIYKDGEMVHDPHESNDGLVTNEYYYTLTKQQP